MHLSDCAVHNEPAHPAGPCDCGGMTDEQRIRERMIGARWAIQQMRAAERRTPIAEIEAEVDALIAEYGAPKGYL